MRAGRLGGTVANFGQVINRLTTKTMTLIPVSSPSEFPASNLAVNVSRSVTDAEAWGNRRGAETLYYYQHKSGNMITAAIVVESTKKDIP